jgi:hypothetical protein
MALVAPHAQNSTRMLRRAECFEFPFRAFHFVLKLSMLRRPGHAGGPRLAPGFDLVQEGRPFVVGAHRFSSKSGGAFVHTHSHLRAVAPRRPIGQACEVDHGTHNLIHLASEEPARSKAGVASAGLSASSDGNLAVIHTRRGLLSSAIPHIHSFLWKLWFRRFSGATSGTV